MQKKYLSETHPEIAKQWHPTKNGDLMPSGVTAGCGKKVWWECPIGEDHEWQARVCGRKRSGCAVCAGKLVVTSTSLATINPDIAREWHSIKNLDLTPNDVSVGSHKKVWWKCLKIECHEWQASVGKRVGGRGCPICAGKKVDISNCLATKNPELALQWHLTKNGNLTPSDFTAGSDKKVWWKCPKGEDHEWIAAIKDRSNGSGCPACVNQMVVHLKSLAITNPEIASQWHKTKNEKLRPNDVSAGSGQNVWWQCLKVESHEWKSVINNRVNGTECPHCNPCWTVEKIRNFIISILPKLDALEPVELYVLFQQNGLLGSSGKGKSFVKNFVDGKFPKEELEKIIDDPVKFDELIENQSDFLTDDDELKTISELDFVDQEKDLPIIETKDILAAIDSKIFASADAETVDFLIQSAVAKIWRHAFYNENEAFKQLELYNVDGEYALEVKRTFSENYEGAKNLEIPAGYNPNPPEYLPKKENLGLMQRYVAYKIKTRKRFGNWSGTGAGKTLSAILASRVIEAKLTVVCCPNNVIDTWKNQILDSYSSSVIYTKESIFNIPNDSEHKYLIINYEFFQQTSSEAILKWLVENLEIDFIVMDEIHFLKQRVFNNVSKRKTLISAFLSEVSNKNQNLSVLGMSATPVINNLFEGKTMIELITGVFHDELDTRSTVSNCIALYKKFVSNGIRYMPKYFMQFNRKIEKIDCIDFIEEIRCNKTNIELEAILTRAKIPFILKQLKSKTIVYTHYRDGIEIILQEEIDKNGWRVAFFNGDTKDGLDKFISGDADILIASSCVGTGIDGLQAICNRLIINCLPWTHAEYMQLVGRIYRQGQKKQCVDIIIPLTFADINGGHWSWCESRLSRIEFKKSIADAAVDGVIPEGNLRTPEQARKDVMQLLERLDKTGIHEVERSKISLQLIGDIKKPALRKISDLSKMNQNINRETSENMHKRFVNNPKEWHEYHAVYREARKEWEVVPYKEAINRCRLRKSHLIVGDFGCGEAFLAQELENKVYSFDHVAINDKVIACDMSHVPLESSVLDVAIFSLALMGTNFVDYLKEAKRCLKLDGHLWIAESTSRIKDINLFKELLDRLGFYVIHNCEKGKFTFIEAIKSDREINEIVLNDIDCKNILE